MRPLVIEDDEDILNGYYSDHSWRIAQYLSDLQRSQEMTAKEFRAFKIDAHRYIIKDRHLFRRANKNIPLRRVIDSVSHRQQILKQLYDQKGHRGREGTYRRVADRYWWENLNKDVKEYVRTYESCQRRSSRRIKKPLYSIWVNVL